MHTVTKSNNIKPKPIPFSASSKKLILFDVSRDLSRAGRLLDSGSSPSCLPTASAAAIFAIDENGEVIMFY